MSWGRELWDQRESVWKHTQQSIDFLDKCSNFVRDRSRIEQDYAKALRRLVKQYQFKKKEEDDLQYTYLISFKQLLREVDDYAGQHECISETLQDNVYKEMHQITSESKSERKKFMAEVNDVKSNLDAANRQMQATKRDFEKASQEAEVALKQYETASNSMDLTKAQIMKFQNGSKDKGQAAERDKTNYVTALENFNKTQTLFYEVDLPRILDDKMQTSEENRTDKLQGFFKAITEAQRAIMPIINRCLEGMDTAAGICDAKKDSQTLIDTYKTGHPRPDDVPFEEFGKPQQQTLPGPRSPKPTKHKTRHDKTSRLFPSREKKNLLNQEEYADDFSELPPEQRRKKFHKKIKELEEQINQLNKTREGMVKISETCQQFGGDLQSIQSQLESNAKEIDKTNLLLHQYQCYLAVIEETNPPSQPTKLSSSASVQSFVSVSSAGEVAPAPVQPNLDSQLPVSNSDIPPPPAPPPPPTLSPPVPDEFDEPKCTALYDFQGRSEGELTASAGEELIIVEDDGSGWTLVARGSEEGYVPTTYLHKL